MKWGSLLGVHKTSTFLKFFHGIQMGQTEGEVLVFSLGGGTRKKRTWGRDQPPASWGGGWIHLGRTSCLQTQGRSSCYRRNRSLVEPDAENTAHRLDGVSFLNYAKVTLTKGQKSIQRFAGEAEEAGGVK